jgi:hypothetical protein
MFLEQLCSVDNTTMLEWQHLSPRLQHLPKGKKPEWFSWLERKIITDFAERTIAPHIQPQGFNPFAYITNNIPKNQKPWLLTYRNDEIIIGKIRKVCKRNQAISITHWTHNIDMTHPNIYPLPPIACTPCSGCHLNTNRITSHCTVEVSAIISTQFFG